MGHSTHTPGPWQAHVRDSHGLHTDADEVIVTRSGENTPVAFLHPTFLACALKGRNEPNAWDRAVQQVKADTALIVAAPELLEAARFMLQVYEEGADNQTFRDGLEMLRDAIDKAEGRAS